MKNMLWFDDDFYVTENMIIVIIDNILLIIIFNTVDIMWPFNLYNMFHQDQFIPHIFYYN